MLALWLAAVLAGSAAALEEPSLPSAPMAPLRLSAQEEFLKSQISTQSLEGFLNAVSSRPHVAGSPADLELADWLDKTLASHGHEVKVSEYQVLLSYPEDASLELVKPSTGSLLSLEGERLPSKAGLAREDLVPWNAYSPSGEAAGQVIYANYGRPEDFEALERWGLSVRGKIVLTRYGSGYRGGKTLEAQKRGASAILFYSDPADDGYSQGDELPKGPWGPPDHFQRGATVYDFIVPGDPLTPGWASVPGARRLKPEDSQILPRIPSVPLTYRAASRILAGLEGPVAPKDWRGTLPLTYHVGPGPAEARLKVKNKLETRPIRNVLAYVKGSQEPEKLVIVSAHHDAWTRGAIDDGIGTAAMLELSRILGLMVQKGWRPRRTLVLASWDAEEYTLTGSTEWGEENESLLRNHGVAVLNMDAYRWGDEFTAIGVPALRGLVRGAMADVPDPSGRGSLYDAWQRKARDKDAEALIGPVGSGSDYTVFLNRMGVPAVETMFTGTAGAYHSIYDDADWVRRVDPGLRRVAAITALNALMAWRVADAVVLPFDYSAYAKDIRRELKAVAAERGLKDEEVAGSYAALDAWEVSGRELLKLRGRAWPEDRSACANTSLMQLERDLLLEGGLPGRPWFKHIIYAPRPTYEAEVLPGLREALEAGERGKAAIQLDILELTLRRAAQTQERAAECFHP